MKRLHFVWDAERNSRRVKEDNILDMVKKVFVIIIAALLIVAVCVVMMYVL